MSSKSDKSLLFLCVLCASAVEMFLAEVLRCLLYSSKSRRKHEGLSIDKKNIFAAAVAAAKKGFRRAYRARISLDSPNPQKFFVPPPPPNLPNPQPYHFAPPIQQQRQDSKITKPNPKGIFVQCRHSDTRLNFVPDEIRQNTNYSQTLLL